MVRWLEFVERTAREQRHPSRVESRPDAAPHEQYLWDSGFHWGEWLVPDEDLSDFGAFIAADKSDVATAFFARSTEVAAQIAQLLGRDVEAKRYRVLSEAVVDAWHAEFVGPSGEISPQTQANLVRALPSVWCRPRCGSLPWTGWTRWCARTARASRPASCRRPICCPCWQTAVTSTRRTTCSSRTRRPRG